MYTAKWCINLENIQNHTQIVLFQLLNTTTNTAYYDINMPHTHTLLIERIINWLKGRGKKLEEPIRPQVR